MRWVKTLSFQVTLLDIGTLCLRPCLHFTIHLAPGALDHAPFAAGAMASGGWQVHRSSYIQCSSSNFRSNPCNMMTWQTCQRKHSKTSEIPCISANIWFWWGLSAQIHTDLCSCLSWIGHYTPMESEVGQYFQQTLAPLRQHWISKWSRLNSSKESSISSDIASFNKSPKGWHGESVGRRCCCWCLPREYPKTTITLAQFTIVPFSHLERSLVLNHLRWSQRFGRHKLPRSMIDVGKQLPNKDKHADWILTEVLNVTKLMRK